MDVASIVLGIAAVCIATVEAIAVVTHLGAVDVYLLAAILLIFGFALYELFIGQVEPSERAALAPRLLLIRSLDNLKEWLAKVVLVVLVGGAVCLSTWPSSEAAPYTSSAVTRTVAAF